MSEDSLVKKKYFELRKIPSAESYLTLHERIQSVSQEIRNPASPPGMKKVIQENTDKVLYNIRDQLTEFAKFTIDLQNTTPAEWQLSTDTSTSSKPEISDQKLPQSVNSWPHNAPLKDAFQMVRDLLWRMSSVIDQVSLELPIESNIFTPSQSYLFNLYYTQYVFQLSLFILQTITEQLDEFTKVIYENSGEKAAEQTSGVSTKTDPRSKNVYKHKSRIFVEGKEYKPNVLESLSSSEEINELPESRVRKQELKKRASHAVEVLLLLLENMLVHFSPDGLKRFGSTRMQVPFPCPKCSKSVVDDLRRYSSRENLHVETYQKSSHERMWNVGIYPIEKKRRKSTNNTKSELQFYPDDIPTELRSAPGSRTRLNWKNDRNISTADVRPRSSRFCQTDSEENVRFPEDKLMDIHTETGTMDNNYVTKNVHKMNSHQLPGIEPSTRVITRSPILRADLKKSVISITKSSEHSIPNFRDVVETGNLPFKSEVNFNLSRFCSMLKEQFRELFYKEKTNSDQSKATDTITITNILIYCFQKSSGGSSEKTSTSVPKTGDLSSNDADVENNVSSNNYTKVNEHTIEQHEALVDKAIDQFVDDTYKFVVTAKEKRKNSENTAAPAREIHIQKDKK